MLRNFFFYFLFSFMLASCAGVGEKAQYPSSPVETGTTGPQNYPAWKQPRSTPGSADTNKAVQDLLQQADRLIANREMEQASEKLERLLRIEPAYAQAWSRLAWIALQSDSPGRAQQMAQRSNSYAKNDKALKLLNWTFIKDAAQLMGKEELVKKSEEMINLLDESAGGS
jgi:Tfp pilus assembly protein PilF